MATKMKRVGKDETHSVDWSVRRARLLDQGHWKTGNDFSVCALPREIHTTSKPSMTQLDLLQTAKLKRQNPLSRKPSSPTNNPASGPPVGSKAKRAAGDFTSTTQRADTEEKGGSRGTWWTGSTSPATPCSNFTASVSTAAQNASPTAGKCSPKKRQTNFSETHANELKSFTKLV